MTFMPDHGLTLNDWITLRAAIRDGCCTPFFGAGAWNFPTGTLAGRLVQTWENLHQRTCPLPPWERDRLDSVAQLLAVTFDAGFMKRLIALHIQKASPPDFSDPNEPHRYFAELEIPLYLTTNYDSFMVEALQRAGKNPEQEFARWPSQTVTTRRLTFHNSNKPVVFHFHGWAKDPDGIQAIVASEDDYLDFLVSVVRGAPAIIPLSIQKRICQTTLLFLGYSLRDVSLRVLLRYIHGTMSSAQRLKAVAVQLSPDDARYRNYLEDYFSDFGGMKIMVFWGTIAQFIGCL